MYCHGQCRVMYRFAGGSLDRTRGCHRLLIESCFDSFCIPLSTTELVKERKEKNEKEKEKREESICQYEGKPGKPLAAAVAGVSCPSRTRVESRIPLYVWHLFR